MANANYERYRNPMRNWWVSLVLGIIFLAVGVAVFFHPGESYVALAFVFGVMVLVSGIMQVYVGVDTPAQSGKGWLIAAGIIEVLLGILLFLLPGVLVAMLPFILGFWLMFRGFTAIGVASDMMAYGVRGGGWTIFFAILLIICSFLVIINPIIGAGAIVIWLGVSLVIAGISLIAFAFYLNSVRRQLKKL